MPKSIEDTLQELDKWYNELSGGTERPKLLSKLATMEYCGWLELYLDSLIERIGQHCGLSIELIHTKVTNPNYGFSYCDHLRPMIVKIIGEIGVLTFENAIDKKQPGFLDRLKSELGSLWKDRGFLAHTTLSGPVKQQVTINAPSWAINRQHVMAKTFITFESELIQVLNVKATNP